jgi:hypothetical protein
VRRAAVGARTGRWDRVLEVEEGAAVEASEQVSEAPRLGFLGLVFWDILVNRGEASVREYLSGSKGGHHQIECTGRYWGVTHCTGH